MDEGVTDSDGHFELKGHETEVTDIDPKVNVYHKCNDEGKVSEIWSICPFLKESFL